MADPRTFTLIGEFKDGITPELEKINRQLSTLKNAFGNIGGKGARSTARDMGRLNVAVSSFADSIKKQNQELRTALEPMRAYRSEIKRIASAYKALNAQSGNAKGIRDTNRALAEQLRLQNQLRSRGGGVGARPPRGGGGLGGGERLGGGGGGGGERPGMGAGGFHMAEFGFAYTLGSAISQPIQNAIVTGFQIGVGLMTKPFEYFANNFGERMKDEMSDLKAAGGFFSISKEQGDKGFVKTFRDAVDFTQENNRIMDRMAATLPGITEDYVEVSKRISDSVARVVANDPKKAALYAESLRKKEPQYFKEMTKPITEMKGGEQQKASIQAILADLTKSTVLAGQGGRAGAGGAMGAYGLPQLTERILSQQEVSIGQFQRYSAIFSDPMIMSALQKELPNIQKTAASSVDRAKAIKVMFEKVLPPELVEAYRRTMSGVTEGFRTALVGKESGLFGLGRPLTDAVEQFDEFGRLIKNADGTVKKTNIGLYNFVRDMAVNLGQVFQPIAENITLMYDPLNEVAKKLADARKFTYKFLESFNIYVQGFKDLGFEGGEATLRGSLAAIANLLKQVGAIGSGDFSKYIETLKGKLSGKALGAMMRDMIDKLLNSEAAANLGKTIGEVIGTVISEVAQVTGFISGRLKQSNKLFDGLKAGFEAAGGPAAFANIFKDVFSSIGKVLLEIAKIVPFQAYVLAAAMLVLPAAIQGAAMAIASALGRAVFGIGDKMGPLAQTMMTRSAAAQGLGRRGKGFGTYQGAPQRRGAGGSIQRLNRMRRYKMAQTAQFAGEAADLGYSAMGRPGSKTFGGIGKRLGKVGKGIGRVGKFVPGGAMAAGAIDMGLALASGENFGKAAAGAIGTVIGGAVGTIFGPAGTLIGSMAGGMIADAGYGLVSSAFNQNNAAKMQMDAASKQLAASQAKLGGIGVTPLGGAAAGVADPMKLAQVLQMMNLRGNALADQYLEQTSKLRGLADSAKLAGDQLNAQINVYKNLGFTSEQIAALPSIKRLQDEYNVLQGKTKTAGDTLKTTFDKMPEAMKLGISTAMAKFDPNIIAYAIANKINMSQMQLNLTGGIFQGPGLGGGGLGGGGLGGGSFSAFGNNPLGLPPAQKPQKAQTRYDGKSQRAMPLQKAIASEMKHKPPGSDLVIANSSETVIPAHRGWSKSMGRARAYSAAGGFGMGAAGQVTNNITINQQPGQDANELAAIVALKIGEAVADARAASIFV